MCVGERDSDRDRKRKAVYVCVLATLSADTFSVCRLAKVRTHASSLAGAIPKVPEPLALVPRLEYHVSTNEYSSSSTNVLPLYTIPFCHSTRHTAHGS